MAILQMEAHLLARLRFDAIYLQRHVEHQDEKRIS